jgi:hypothetical protein
LEALTGLFEAAQHFLQSILGAVHLVLERLAMDGFALVELGEEFGVPLIHTIRRAHAVFDGRAESDVGGWLAEDLGI